MLSLMFIRLNIYLNIYTTLTAYYLVSSQEAMREKIYTPLSVESAVDARYTLWNTFSSYLQYCFHCISSMFFSTPITEMQLPRSFIPCSFNGWQNVLMGGFTPRTMHCPYLYWIYTGLRYTVTLPKTHFDTFITLKVKCAVFIFWYLDPS